MKNWKIRTAINLPNQITLLIIVIAITFLSFDTPKPHSGKVNLANEEFIDWDINNKLTINDFKSKNKESDGSAVAITASAFGFSITDSNGIITGSIYVRFYPNRSWWDPDHRINGENHNEILKHEQLHFDICELFGRKLFKEVLYLKRKGKLNEKTINELNIRLDNEYSRYQDNYDKETNHSINRRQQLKWNSKVKRDLQSLSAYANYHKF